MKKRIASVVLALCMLLPMLPTTALAANVVNEGSCGANGDNVTWTLDSDGVLTISGEGAMQDYDWDRAPWSYAVVLKSVVIDDGITSIGDFAFYGCRSLTSVNIPITVTSIGVGAFYGCRSLTSVNIPENVTRIGRRAFEDSGLTSVTIPENVTSIEAGTFSGCYLLNSVTIPGSVTSIGEGAFSGCDLTSVDIPDAVTSIGAGAFSGCNLTSVDIPDAVTSIGAGAFSGCGLTSIKIPDGVTSIGDSVFSDCHNLTSVEIPEKVTSIGVSAFAGCFSLESVTIPENVTSIGVGAFSGCFNLDSMTIPASVDSIGEGAFSNTNISSIQVAEGNSKYASQDGVLFTEDMKTLVACPSRKTGEYAIPDGVTGIGASAFSGCSDLTSVKIPDSVESIGDSAFYNCSGLTSVDIPNSVTSIGDLAFYNCDGLTSVDIPDGVTSIGDWAFEDCSGLKSVTIPDSVDSIGEAAFSRCSELTSVTIPNGVTSIGGWTFSNCSSLTSVDIPNSVTSIGDSAFSWCNGLTNVTIPDGVTSIGDRVFENCSGLTSVTIPDSVTSIGWWAFSGCGNLKDVYYGGSEEEWEKLVENKDIWGIETQNVTIHYDYQTPEYTVTFDLNYTDVTGAPDEQTVTDGGTVTKPADPTREGYKFDGWYKDAECTETEKWDFETDTVTADITLYAKWTKEETPPEETKYTVTFDSQGGSAVASQTVTSGGKVTKPADPTWSSHTFDGWYKEQAYTNAWNFDTDTVTADTTLYAKWTEDTPPAVTEYTVTFDSQGGSAVASQTVTSGGKVTKPADPTRDGYTFGGWYKEPDCTNAWNFTTDAVTATTTLYAKWTKEETPPEETKYTVTFDSQSGSAVASQTITSGGKVTKPADPTWSGHTFDGWYKEAACTNAWDFDTDTVTEDITLYAKWTEDTPPEETKYTVTFNTQGGSAVASQTVTGGGKVTKPADPTRSDHTFGGWYKEQACTNAWDFDTDTVTENTTLYAKWTKEEAPPTETKYTVTFDSQGGSAVASQTVTSGGKAIKPDLAPTRAGYTFGGWYKEQACTNAWDFDTDTVTENTTLYAKWTEDSGTTTPTETYHRIYTDYYTSGGSIYMSHSSAAEGTRVTIEVSPRSGYELDWLSVYNLNTGRELTLTRRYYDTYTFSMPNAPVGVEVSFFREDIDSGSWYVPEIIPVSNKTASSKPVRWYYKNGQIGHVTDGTVPYGTLLTRDMLISILYNMDPNSTGEPLFWATQQKVMPDIYPSGLWGTDKNISREQAAMILYNYSRHMGYNLSPSLDLTGCADYEEMRPIARTAMSWAQATGLFSRNLLNMLSPKSTLTCGEVNALLSRFVSTVARTR